MKRLLLLAMLICSPCFGEWEFDSVIDHEIDVAKKYRVRVQLKNEDDSQVIVLKFQNPPDEKAIFEEVNKYCLLLEDGSKND